MMAERDPSEWPDGAERLFDAVAVSQAFDGLAKRLAGRMPDGVPVTVMALMNGGMYPAVALTRRMRRPLMIEYVHATRYRGGKTGGEILWEHFPSPGRLSECVLLIDDIFDEGYTMEAVRERLHKEGVNEVLTAVLALKQHRRGLDRDWIDDHALVVPDRFVFGCGMDLHGYWRQLDEIWAV